MEIFHIWNHDTNKAILKKHTVKNKRKTNNKITKHNHSDNYIDVNGMNSTITKKGSTE